MAHKKGTLAKGARVVFQDNTNLRWATFRRWEGTGYRRQFFLPNQARPKKLKGPVFHGTMVGFAKGVKRQDGCIVRRRQTQRIAYKTHGIPRGSRIKTWVLMEQERAVLLLAKGMV